MASMDQDAPSPNGHHRCSTGVDIGGTFTDGVLLDAHTGRLTLSKFLTTPKDPSKGAEAAARPLLQQTGLDAAQVFGPILFVPSSIDRIKHPPIGLNGGLSDAPGGGGYGHPAERDPEAVARDVAGDYISHATAREVYRGVVDADGRLDDAATSRLRAEHLAAGR
jgi:hypothetical protein